MSVVQTNKIIKRSQNTINDWNNLYRYIYIGRIDTCFKMDNPGCIIQIDESLFRGKIK